MGLARGSYSPVHVLVSACLLPPDAHRAAHECQLQVERDRRGDIILHHIILQYVCIIYIYIYIYIYIWQGRGERASTDEGNRPRADPVSTLASVNPRAKNLDFQFKGN